MRGDFDNDALREEGIYLLINVESISYQTRVLSSSRRYQYLFNSDLWCHPKLDTALATIVNL